MDPNVVMSDAVSYAFTILKAMKEDGNLPSCDYYERLLRTRVSVGKMKEKSEAHGRALVVADDAQIVETQTSHQLDGQVLGFSEGLPLDHPLIDSFLADQGTWSNGMSPEDQFLRDLACELGDEFLFGPQ
ncbi:hypothetical protein N7508_007146 [Penicillium antarcticum]|uniref:uncharacterized protein n=1 Tax=Penicillium antarcticum TaxID=416450 RepID=UPI002395E5AC|nr:uncharacterized protein N7508_007146 [Penicillium antarcticum]KAJ5302283.1 hypothetical protein N7508_007146 [Penicillium antarcticum]